MTAISDPNTDVETTTERRSGFCPQWKVFMHNDDKTHMDFVVFVLINIFNMEHQKAIKTMWQVHTEDIALVGVYPKEHAELRVEQTRSLAQARGFPLACTLEAA